MPPPTVRRGDIVWVLNRRAEQLATSVDLSDALDPNKPRRMFVIVHADGIIRYHRNFIGLPLSSIKTQTVLETWHVRLDAGHCIPAPTTQRPFPPVDTYVDCSQIHTLPDGARQPQRPRFTLTVGKVTQRQMKELERGLIEALDLPCCDCEDDFDPSP